MNTALHFLDDSDLVSMGVLIAILCFVGGKMVTVPSRVHSWSLRLAVAGFVAYCIYGYAAVRPSDAGGLSAIAFRALFAAALTLGTSWIVLPIVAFLYGSTLGAFFKKVQDWTAALRIQAVEKQARQKEEKQRRQAQREYERQAPQREQARREAEARATVDADERRRRADARANCELLFALYAPELGARFDKEMFDDFLKRHLGDDQSADYVDQRSQQLQVLIQQHYEKVHPTPKFKNMVELATWFEQQKQQLDALPIDGKAKRVHLANLNRRFQELMSEHLENSGP